MLHLNLFKNTKYYKNKWDKVFKSGLSKVCGRKSLKNLEGYGLVWEIGFLMFSGGTEKQHGAVMG